jgi:hypothetical protein
MNGLIYLLGRPFLCSTTSRTSFDDPIASTSTYFTQLSAYFEGLTNVGSVEVAINWLSPGTIALFDFTRL